MRIFAKSREAFWDFKLIYLLIFTMITVSSFLPGSISAADQAEDFFSDSNVEFYAENDKFYLRLQTPQPVLCAVNFGEDPGKYTELTAMEMSAPALEHLIELGLDPDKTYYVTLTAFTENHEVFRSREYVISTRDYVDGDNILLETNGSAEVMEVERVENYFTSEPEILEVGSGAAAVSFVTEEPTIASTAFGPDRDFGRLARLGTGSPVRETELSLYGLDAATEYYLETLAIDPQGELGRSEIVSLQTLEASAEGFSAEKNWASQEAGAEVKAVSSNFGQDPEGAFGSVNAIDNDPGTEWSSQGEGNQAWIEIELPTEIEITGFGFWTRTMGETGQIFKVRMLTGTGEVIGEFDIPSADQLYNFQVSPVTASTVRFEVVESSGGNTGARQIKVYGRKVE
ncbi:MAG: discoidin domain-containing protein [Bacillota bacterium]